MTAYVTTLKNATSLVTYQSITVITHSSGIKEFKRHAVSGSWGSWDELSKDFIISTMTANKLAYPAPSPAEKNLNNISESSTYQFSSADATQANNFPVVSNVMTAYVTTLKIGTSLVTYQSVTVITHSSGIKEFKRRSVSGTWSLWEETSANALTSNPFVNPVYDPTEKNLNNISVNSVYQYPSTYATVENNFPVVGERTYVETFKLPDSAFITQRATVIIFGAEPRLFIRSGAQGSFWPWTEVLTASPTKNLGFDDAAWYKYTRADSQPIYQDKLPKFRRSNLLKDKDVCVVMTGTSLTASTSQHCTLLPDAHLRPPNMHAAAFGSYIWDTLKWEGQQYRRYDASYFTEVGTFETKSKDNLWDDPTRDGLTRISADANASVGFVIPIDAWQFNFIYRTESTGCTASVSVAEGNGKVQVYDETTASWVEANGYQFSMLETTPVTRTVVIPNLITEAPENYTLASKANTTYQKRLKMRCRSSDGAFDSRASAKNVTIANASSNGRLLYWGVEWSPREYMMTFINSSRGSHATDARKTSGLPRYQDNEVWGFKPDLILAELAIHNDGASGAGALPVGTWQQLAKQYVTDTNYELSLYSRAAHFNLEPEYSFFVGSITWNFGGINEDGTLKFSTQTASVLGDARSMSALDKYQEAINYLRSQNIVCLDTAEHWVEACKAVFGDLKSATVASGKTGATFTDEGSHWNNNGAKVMAKAVIPLIK
ncbi:pyocin knob domain-containing protein [Acinetobacter sp. Ver3]|uniref:pyocin knob domain-containing protein n=1 Tax=Acinetobacter sp. Ver3 TaxID=466088 RepID=UPI0012DB724D|nr:pyocin knob domain-containing protein [Acinetobacter sp. Ver3]